MAVQKLYARTLGSEYRLTEMTFSEHLQELRKIFIYLIVFLVTLLAINFFPAQFLLKDFLHSYSVVSLKPLDSFNSVVLLDFILTALIVFPVFVFLAYNYIKPAFNEIKALKFYAIFSALLFYLGCFFGLVIFNSTILDYAISFSQEIGIKTFWGIEDIMQFSLINILLFGFVFQIPILVFLALKYNLVPEKILLKNSYYAIPIIFIVSAWITPPDVFSMFAMAIPILLLFYGSFAVFLFMKKLGGEKVWRLD